MSKKLTQEEAEKRVIYKCKEKNYTLIKKFTYINSKTKIHLKCNKDDYEWVSIYNNFVNQNKGCSKCVNVYKPTQEEAEQIVLKKCKEKNYTLVESFIYINAKETKFHLKCNKDNYKWFVTYDNFINNDTGCHKCAGGLKITQEEAEKRVIDKCKEKNYTLFQPFIYIDANNTRLQLICNIDKYKWSATYNQFINSNCGCKKCAGTLKITQEEAEKKVLNKCKEKNYILVKPFTYLGNKKTIIHLKCNNDNHEWFPIYNNFINKNRNCSKCSKKYKSTQKEIEEKVLNKCKEKNYELVESFIYTDAINTILHLKCNNDNHEWFPTYNNFINNNRCCQKCAGTLKITQDVANELVLNKCKERNYELVEPFIYINNETKIHLKCNKDNHEWFPKYNNFIKCNKGCPICNESRGEYKISKFLKNKNIFFKREYKFENCKYKKLLQFDFYLPDLNICIEYDGQQHFEIVEKWGGEKTLNDTKIRDKIKTKYCLDNNIQLLRIKYDDDIELKMNELFTNFY
jgi:hypothetical protein